MFHCWIHSRGRTYASLSYLNAREVTILHLDLTMFHFYSFVDGF